MQTQKVNLDQLVIKTLYYQYKEFVTPVTTIAICLVLIFLLVVPQLQNWLAMKDEITGDTQKLTLLQQNLQTITSLDDTKLDTYVKVATDALPSEKDFESILNAIDVAALQAGTSLGDYNFQLGDLSAGGAGLQLPLQLSITIQGDIEAARKFIVALKNQLPISQVVALNAAGNGTVAMTVTFYYAPMPKIAFDDSAPLPLVSKNDENLLLSLSQLESGATVTNGIQLAPTPLVGVSPTPIVSTTSTPSGSSTPTIQPSLSPSPTGSASGR